MTSDVDDDTADPTFVIDRQRRVRPRDAVAEPVSAPAEGDEGDPPRRRGDDDETVRVRRTAMETSQPEPEAPRPVPTGRVASSPDPDALKTPYAARPVSPVVAIRAEHRAPMAQSSVDGETIDRSIRGKARRRVAGLALIITGSVCVAGGLLAILLSSLG